MGASDRETEVTGSSRTIWESSGTKDTSEMRVVGGLIVFSLVATIYSGVLNTINRSLWCQACWSSRV